jgi:hypothetical protein
MLKALLESRHRSRTRDELRAVLGMDDESLSFPDQAIIDQAKNLRAALKKAVKEVGRSCKNPLPSKGRGEDLTYSLAMP